MKFDRKGSGSLVLVFVIIILGFIAYGIFKNRTLAPTEDMMVPTSEDEGQGNTSSTPSQGTRTNTYQNTSTTTTTSQTTTETESLTEIEMEAESLETEMNDLMFDDLGFE